MVENSVIYSVRHSLVGPAFNTIHFEVPAYIRWSVSAASNPIETRIRDFIYRRLLSLADEAKV